MERGAKTLFHSANALMSYRARRFNKPAVQGNPNIHKQVVGEKAKIATSLVLQTHPPNGE